MNESHDYFMMLLMCFLLLLRVWQPLAVNVWNSLWYVMYGIKTQIYNLVYKWMYIYSDLVYLVFELFNRKQSNETTCIKRKWKRLCVNFLFTESTLFSCKWLIFPQIHMMCGIQSPVTLQSYFTWLKNPVMLLCRIVWPPVVLQEVLNRDH